VEGANGIPGDATEGAGRIQGGAVEVADGIPERAVEIPGRSPGAQRRKLAMPWRTEESVEVGKNRSGWVCLLEDTAGSFIFSIAFLIGAGDVQNNIM
jgi:hypothetical protein